MSYESLCFNMLDARVSLRRVQFIRMRRRTWRTWWMLQRAEALVAHLEF